MTSMPSSNKSNLMERIGAFLPQLKAANEELLEQNGQAQVQIDDKLVKDTGEDDDDDDEGEVKDEKTQTIELKVELGDVKHNQQVFDLLGSNEDDDTNNEQSAKSDTVDDDTMDERTKTVTRLLQEGKKDKLPRIHHEETNSSTKKQKKMIEELS